jgi:hypothetical protein
LNINRRNAVIYKYFTYFKVTEMCSNPLKIIVMYRTPSINRKCPSVVGYLRPKRVGAKLYIQLCSIYCGLFLENMLDEYCAIISMEKPREGEETIFRIRYFGNSRADTLIYLQNRFRVKLHCTDRVTHNSLYCIRCCGYLTDPPGSVL